MKQLLAMFSLMLLISNAAISAAPIVSVAPAEHSIAQSISRISVASDGTQANDGSGSAALSADGRYIAFESLATNLVSGDTNGVADIFVQDRVTHETTRVSVTSDGTQANGVFPGSEYPSISADGRYIAFQSTASNLVNDDTNDAIDVFVYDRQEKHTIRISLSSNGIQGNSFSQYPSISADGHYVTFMSDANNLVSGDTGPYEDIFLHDMETGQTTLVSIASGGSQADNPSQFPVLSADGRYVAFESFAGNLGGGLVYGTPNVFVHDRLTSITIRASLASDGTPGNDQSTRPSISADGRFAMFPSAASNLVPGDANNNCPFGPHTPSIYNCPDTFVHDIQTAETILVSVSSDNNQGNYGSEGGAISSTGRYVTFTSSSNNLVISDTNGVNDVFLRDMLIGWTTRVSVAANGAESNYYSGTSALSANGHSIAFGSGASNLVSGDTNESNDVFVVDWNPIEPFTQKSFLPFILR
jgi:WD40 repeat protein